MVGVKSLKIDGEPIHIFNSAIYIFVATSGLTLELNVIVTEVVLKKYKKEENLFIDIELDNGNFINAIMHLKVLARGLPQLHLFCELNDMAGYEELNKVNENDSWFPNIENGITIEDIRKVEMPIEVVSLKLNLPIDQVEWLKNQKKAYLNEFFQKMIYQHWKEE